MLEVSVNTNLSRFSDFLYFLLAMLNDRSEVLKEVGDYAAKRTQEGFDESTSPDGESWAPLDPQRYPYRPDRDGVIRPPSNPTTSSSKPLLNHGNLKASISYGFVSSESIRVGYFSGEKAKIAALQQGGLPSEAQFEKDGRRYTKTITPRPRRIIGISISCLLYTSPSPRDGLLSRMPSSA